jgi:hemerythrin
VQAVTWSPEMVLGVPEMDDAHKALLAELARLDAAPDDQFGAGFLALITALERDFQGEEALMEKIDFPALRSHREQHARVLSGLHHVAPDVMRGDFTLGREATKLLPQWFQFHLSTMDAALAVALELADSPDRSPSRRSPGPIE